MRSILERFLQNYKIGGMTPYGISENAFIKSLLNVLQINGNTERIRFLGDIDLKTYVNGKWKILLRFKTGLI